MAKLADQFDGDECKDILDLGSGWGFTSEYMARLGHRVVAVDINPDFVEVAGRRSDDNRLGIDYRLGTFDRLPLAPDEKFDVIMSFELFHHCRAPLAALTGMANHLRAKGQVILAGEPFIQSAMWPAWGLRLDALSIYCIAKFGWWEVGLDARVHGLSLSRRGSAERDGRLPGRHGTILRWQAGAGVRGGADDMGPRGSRLATGPPVSHFGGNFDARIPPAAEGFGPSNREFLAASGRTCDFQPADQSAQPTVARAWNEQGADFLRPGSGGSTLDAIATGRGVVPWTRSLGMATAPSCPSICRPSKRSSEANAG